MHPIYEKSAERAVEYYERLASRGTSMLNMRKLENAIGEARLLLTARDADLLDPATAALIDQAIDLLEKARPGMESALASKVRH